MIPILSGNVASATASTAVVSNSCRFNSGDSAKMAKSSSGGTRTKWTFSTWFKRCRTGAVDYIFSSYSGSNYCYVQINGDDNLRFLDYSSGNNCNKITDRKFRDPSAWYHMVVQVDTTDGTAGDRFKLWINGVRETSFGTSADYSSSFDTNMNVSGHSLEIGVNQQGNDNYFNGYLAETVLIDGSDLDATSFGEYDEDSPTIWKPKDVSGLTMSGNSFYLDYEDSSNLGNDIAGNGDFTETNLAAADQATDTPENNFATLNPLASLPNTSKSTFSEGNCIAVAGSDASYVNGGSTIGVANGKWYVETKLSSSSDGTARCIIGITMDVSEISRINQDAGSNNIFYSLHYGNFSVAGSTSGFTGLTTSAVGDIIGVALDMDNGKVYFSKNGSWLNSGDPTSGSSGTGAASVAASTTGFRFFFSGSDSNARTMTTAYNFGGCPGFAISSGNADANGYGNFEYAPPTGYYALCSKNLAEFG